MPTSHTPASLSQSTSTSTPPRSCAPALPESFPPSLTQLNRIAAVDPDSTAYHAAARKTLRASTNKSPVRSFGGAKAAAESVRRKEHEALINQGLVR